MAVADVNGDGKPDLVTTSLRQNTVSVLLGNGTGTFSPGQTLAVGPAPTSVAVADLNGDGRPDLVTTNADGNSVSVLLGNGDGTFQPQQTFAVGRSPRTWWWPTSTATACPTWSSPTTTTTPSACCWATATAPSSRRSVFAVGTRPYSLAVADLNGDGKPDLIVANAADDTVSVLLGNGDGTFQPQQTFAAGRQPFSVAVADVNGDGIPDIVTANAFDNTRERAAGQRQRHLPAAAGRSPSVASPPRWRWPTSTATASPTSSPPTTATTP